MRAAFRLGHLSYTSPVPYAIMRLEGDHDEGSFPADGNRAPCAAAIWA